MPDWKVVNACAMYSLGSKAFAPPGTVGMRDPSCPIDFKHCELGQFNLNFKRLFGSRKTKKKIHGSSAVIINSI